MRTGEVGGKEGGRECWSLYEAKSSCQNVHHVVIVHIIIVPLSLGQHRGLCLYLVDKSDGTKKAKSSGI